MGVQAAGGLGIEGAGAGGLGGGDTGEDFAILICSVGW